MKYFYLMLIIAFIGCSQQQNEDKVLKIEKTDFGFDIYSGNNDLLLEFTNMNTDSSSLQTLSYMYDVCSDYNSNPAHFKNIK